MVSDNFYIHDGGQEVCPLQALKNVRINGQVFDVEAQFWNGFFDVFGSERGIPMVIQVKD